MNLLMTADTVGGVWTYALDLARALEPHGVQTTLATMGAPLSPAQREAADSIQTLTLFESAYALEWTPDPWDDVARAGAWLLDLEARVKPDLVHLSGYAHGALPWSAPVLVVGHSCVLSWWEAVKGEAAPPERTRYRNEVRRGLHAADLVVAPTAAMLSALERHYGSLKPCARHPQWTRRRRLAARAQRTLHLECGKTLGRGEKRGGSRRSSASSFPGPSFSPETRSTRTAAKRGSSTSTSSAPCHPKNSRTGWAARPSTRCPRVTNPLGCRRSRRL